MDMYAIIWLVLMVIFLVAEAATVTVTSLWFAAGAMVALLASVLGAKFWLQVVLFLVVSATMLIALRPMIKKYFTPKLTRTNVDAIIGTQGYVTADIDNMAATGTVKLGAMEWTARSADGNPIPKGALVKVDRIEGVKAFVVPVSVTAEV
jgi:membrane protein implicated in regulation of membrane protease activity